MGYTAIRSVCLCTCMGSAGSRVVMGRTSVGSDGVPVSRPAWMDSVSDPAEKTEQNLLTTLEELEFGLLSRGFVPLEPNSLSAIAQAQEIIPAEIVTPEPAQVVAVAQEPTLSSAFAEFGNFVSPRRPQEDLYVAPTGAMLSAQPISAQVLPSIEEPQRVALQSTAPALSLESQMTPIMLPVPSPYIGVTSETKRDSAVPSLPSSTTPVQLANVPVARRETIFDDELEMTMKRPAIRVQPMQQRPFPQRDQTLPMNRVEERVATEKNVNNKWSHQERLIQGYQHQLIGDYDEAMQEYRIIIRSDPEALGEVISNVRALLKLAPKYSPGYRVLGDAYMRQGEYLQAMEAYNKALTMAKKAKG